VIFENIVKYFLLQIVHFVVVCSVNDNRTTSSGTGWGWLGALLLFFFHVIFAIIILLALCWLAVGFVLLVKRLLDGLDEYMLARKIKHLQSPNT
jgi:hypothetical protein